jgi:hypothetical protein
VHEYLLSQQSPPLKQKETGKGDKQHHLECGKIVTFATTWLQVTTSTSMLRCFSCLGLFIGMVFYCPSIDDKRSACFNRNIALGEHSKLLVTELIRVLDLIFIQKRTYILYKVYRVI